MCNNCGVTDEQYDHARLIAHNCCVTSWYQDHDMDPGLYGHALPDEEAIRTANDHIQRYHAAHPGQGLTRDELVAEFAARRGVTTEGVAAELNVALT